MRRDLSVFLICGLSACTHSSTPLSSLPEPTSQCAVEEAASPAIDKKIHPYRTLSGHSARTQVAFQSSEFLITTSQDTTARRWDIRKTPEQKEPLFTLKGHSPQTRSFTFGDGSGFSYSCLSPVVSQDGRRIVTVESEKKIVVWDATTGKRLSTITESGPFANLDLSPSGSLLLTDTGSLWETETGKKRLSLGSFPTGAFAVLFSPDEKIVLVTGSQRGATFYDTQRGTALSTISGDGSFYFPRFSPDSQSFYFWDLDNAAHGIEVSTGRQLQRLDGLVDWGEDVLWVRGQAMLLTQNEHVERENNLTEAKLWDLSGNVVTSLPDAIGKIYERALHPSGELLFLATYQQVGEDPAVRQENYHGFLWDLRRGALIKVEGLKGGVEQAAFSPDGIRLAVVTEDHVVSLFEVEPIESCQGTFATRPVAALQAEAAENIADYTETLALNPVRSPDGSYVLTINEDRLARLWDAKSGALLVSVRYAPYGSQWDRPKKMGFRPDSARFFIAGEPGTEIFDVKTGVRVARLKNNRAGHNGWILDASYHPAGDKMVTAATDYTAKIWDAETGRVLLTLTGHTGRVFTASFSSDGSQVTTTSEDGTTRTWDAATGKQLSQKKTPY